MKINHKKNISPFMISMIFMFAAFLLYCSFQYADTDLYYIIATGKYIVNHGIPHENPFITTTGQRIVIQNWMYCAVVYAVYSHLHTFGLWLLQCIFLAGMVFIEFFFFHIGSKFTERSIIFIMITSAISLCIFSYVNLRPEMLTFILIMLELVSIEKYMATGNRLWLVLLPISMLLEINCHAAYWVMHIVVLLPYLVPVPSIAPVKDSHIKAKQVSMILPAFILSVAMIFINPYGMAAVKYVFHSLSSGILYIYAIQELQPYTVKMEIVWFYVGILFIFFILLAKKKLTSTECYMFIGMSILFITAIKWTPFYCIGLVYLLRACERVAEEKWNNEDREMNVIQVKNVYPIAVKGISIIAGILIVTSGIKKGAADISNSRYLDCLEGCDSYELFCGLGDIADYLDENAVGNDNAIYAPFEIGNYFEYRGYKVYADARPELYIENIAGSDTVTQTVIKVTAGRDIISYMNSKKERKNNTEDISISQFVLDMEDYADAVESTNCNYFVIRPTEHVCLYHYLTSETGIYREVMSAGDYVLFEKKQQITSF